jgi:hypothetical protein
VSPGAIRACGLQLAGGALTSLGSQSVSASGSGSSKDSGAAALGREGPVETTSSGEMSGIPVWLLTLINVTLLGGTAAAVSVALVAGGGLQRLYSQRSAASMTSSVGAGSFGSRGSMTDQVGR